MLPSQSGSYFEEYRRSQGRKAKPGVEDERMLTDRAAYMSFLEVQLERVSAACLTAQGFADRLEEVQASVINYDDKLNNLARAVKLVESTSKHASGAGDLALQEVQGKLEQFENGFHDVRLRTDHTHALMEGVKQEVARLEDKRRDGLDAVQRRVEQRVLDFSGRLELEEARSKANESKLAHLADVARAETKSAIETFQTMLDLKLESVKDNQDLRVAALENRLSSIMDHVKGSAPSSLLNPGAAPSGVGAAAITSGGEPGGREVRFSANLVESQLRSEIEAARKQLSERSEASMKRVMQMLKGLEKQVNQSTSDREQMYQTDVVKTQQTLAKVVHRVNQLELQVEETTRENGVLKRKIQKLQQERPATAASASAPKKEIEALIQDAIKRQNAKLKSMLASVETKLKEQSSLVADSMVKVEDFMDLYDTTHADMQLRLQHGQRHQERLRKLVEDSAAALEQEEQQQDRQQPRRGEPGVGVAQDDAEDDTHEDFEAKRGEPSPFKLAFRELSEIVSSMGSAASVVAASSAATKRGASKGKRRPARSKKTKKKRTSSLRHRSSSEPRSHERPTASSSSRRRSKTPPPFVLDCDEGVSSDLEASKRRDGGGKRGRDQQSMSTSHPLSAQEPAPVDPLHPAEVSDAAGKHGLSRPPWNAPSTHPLGARRSSTSSSTTHSSTSSSSSSANLATQHHRQRLRELYESQ